MKRKLIAMLSAGLLCTAVFADTTTTDSTIQVLSSQNSGQPTADQNQLEGNAFLKANKKRPGVVTLQDGLQYKIIKKGTGARPTEQDVVKVEYAGRLINGTEFDSSAKQGGPVSFPLNQVIPGWIEALKLMPKGSVWEIYVPSTLAYGEAGAPPMIGPNQTLIFKVSLIDFQKNS